MATLPALATPLALGNWLGKPIAADDSRALAVLGAASALVRSFTGQAWVDGVAPEVASQVVIQVASRVWQNREGVVQRQAGPFSYRLSEAAGEGLFLTATEKKMLGGLKAVSRSGLYTIDRERGDLYDLTQYVPTGPPPSGYPFPWYGDDVTI